MNGEQTSYGGGPLDAGFVVFDETGPYFVPNAGLDAAGFNSTVVVGSQGSIFLSNGGNLSVSTEVPLPISTADTTVELVADEGAPLSLEGVEQAGMRVQAPIVFSSPGQINFQMPWEVQPSPDGTVTMIITVNGVSSYPVKMPVETLAPSIYTFDFGPGRAVAINPDGSVAHPAGSIAGVNSRPTSGGEVLIILASGLGPTQPPSVTGDNSFDDNGAFVRRDTLAVPRVLVGGQEAQVVFSGMSPEFPGVYQLNVVLPEGVPTGEQVSLVIVVDGKSSRSDVTIAVE